MSRSPATRIASCPTGFITFPSPYLINAFALPGGHVYVGGGLMELMDSEDELAAVLGHEIEHIDHYHCAERVQREQALRKIPLGGLVALPIEVFEAGYSKDQELESDREGTRLAVEAGYSASGAIRMFETFGRLYEEYQAKAKTPQEELSRVAQQTLEGYFRSHPLPSERITQVRKLIASEGWTPRPERDLAVAYIFWTARARTVRWKRGSIRRPSNWRINLCDCGPISRKLSRCWHLHGSRKQTFLERQQLTARFLRSTKPRIQRLSPPTHRLWPRRTARTQWPNSGSGPRITGEKPLENRRGSGWAGAAGRRPRARPQAGGRTQAKRRRPSPGVDWRARLVALSRWELSESGRIIVRCIAAAPQRYRVRAATGMGADRNPAIRRRFADGAEAPATQRAIEPEKAMVRAVAHWQAQEQNQALA